MDTNTRVTVYGARISHARRLKGTTWSQHRLVGELKKMGMPVTYGWLANIESGRIKSMRQGELQAVAKVLGQQPEYFMTPGAEAPNVAAAASYSSAQVPVFGSVSAESFNFSFDTVPESHLTMALPVAAGKKVGAWRVSGECMKGTAEDGDYIVAVEASDVANGRLAIVRYNGEFTFKRVFKKDGAIELRPDNRAFKKITVRDGDFKIVAEVVWVLKKP